MNLIQDALQWTYIVICFVLIWYGISLILGVWEWLKGRRQTKHILVPFIKLTVTSFLAVVVVWLGAATSV